jgi:hypothetical protein
MNVGESSNDQLFELIACCDIAQAERTNVGVKAALKTRANHQWSRPYTRKRTGNTPDMKTAADGRDGLAK